MTDSPQAVTPLSAEEERIVHGAEFMLVGHIDRLLATLDAARSTPAP